MAAVPVSARWLSGVGAVAFLLPAWSIHRGYGPGGLVLYVFGLGCAVVCAVPPFFSDEKRLRVACTAGGAVVTVVSAPFVFVGALFARFLYYGTLYLAFLALPVTAVAGLVAGFQRAKGRDRGRGPARFAWACAALTLTGWLAVSAWILTLR
ncbi:MULTISPECIES: hypothetical protein [Streptomycetaceae]|uniref:hypothetical protein n=1 Tax=Streptomycetaceae TaxID=2062 RepID=UPI00093B690C|nr:hypothetical protein [Streptomyces sp. CB02056]OKH98699.1 hypothetical protein AMK13_36570 [Streptomyces sp. CB02056]